MPQELLTTRVKRERMPCFTNANRVKVLVLTFTFLKTVSCMTMDRGGHSMTYRIFLGSRGRIEYYKGYRYCLGILST
jgi:hypothetical protein